MQTDDTHFPWRSFHHVQCIRNADDYYAAMLDSIRAAKVYVLLEMYLVQSGVVVSQFVHALCAAAARGVAVHVLLDDFGSRGLQSSDRQLLQAAGVQLAWFNPLKIFKWRLNLVRDHRKLLVVDDAQVYVGGAGLADDFAMPKTRAWHDQMFCITGECVRDWRQLFSDNWHSWSRVPLPLPPYSAPPSAAGYPGRVVAGHYFSAREMRHAILAHVRQAQTRLWICSAYFLPPLGLHRLIRRAARRGVDVRILVPGPITDHPAVRIASQRFYSHMLFDGVRIFEYQPRFMHAKMLIADDLVSMGSCNFDRWSLRWNLEANQEIHDADFAAQMAAHFSHDLQFAHEVNLPEWLGRSRWLRMKESLLGLLEVWAARSSYRAQLKLAAQQRLEKK